MPVDYQDALDLEASDWGEADWESDYSEARTRPAQPGQYAPPPRPKGGVSSADFQTALDKVRQDVAQNSKAIAGVGANVDALNKRTRGEVRSLRTEIAHTRDETRNTIQMLSLMSLFDTGAPVTVTDTGGQTVSVTQTPSPMMQVLPMLMLSGGLSGSGSGSTSPSGGGMDGMMLMFVMMAAMNRPAN